MVAATAMGAIRIRTFETSQVQRNRERKPEPSYVPTSIGHGPM